MTTLARSHVLLEVNARWLEFTDRFLRRSRTTSRGRGQTCRTRWERDRSNTAIAHAYGVLWKESVRCGAALHCERFTVAPTNARPDDIKPFSPEWQAREDAFDNKLRRTMSICRGC